jgi:tRNA 2-selenouridine synthase
MAIERLQIEEFIQYSNQFLLFDVRSPSEYKHAHIPRAINLPLFSDEQRVIVGTAYKQKSKEQAIKHGLDFFGPEMRAIVEKVELLLDHSNKKNSTSVNTVLVHCWRGGMRSGAIAWLLDLYGIKVYLLHGGYKAFRNYVLQTFQLPYQLQIVGGYTGSGKTLWLQALEKFNYKCVDLEKLASHKGSALGAIGQERQPTQEMFENLLASELQSCAIDEILFIEDESQRIGNVKIPDAFYVHMRNSQVLFLELPFSLRLQHLVESYGIHPKEELAAAILRIQKRLGGLETKHALLHLSEGRLSACFEILLTYYDRWYLSGLTNRSSTEDKIVKITSDTFDISKNCKLLLENINQTK